MTTEIIQKIVFKCTCEKCGKEWESKNDKIPDVCTRCKTYKWNESEESQ